MSWQVMPLTRSLGVWREEWDALNQRLYGGHPFRDSGFVEVLLKHFGCGDEKLCIHRTQDRVDGMLILRSGRFGVWRKFVPSQAQAAPVLLERRELLQGLFGALSPMAWMLEFYCQDPQFAPEGLLQEDATTRVLPHALTMNVALTGSFETYWDSRSKNLSKNMRRYARRVTEEFGAPEMRIITDPAAMRDAVMRYGALESAGWKEAAGTAVHIENVQGAFYVDLLQRFAQTGQAEVVEYWLGGKLAASRLVIRGGDMVIILKTTYDESLSKFAPGRLLLQHYLERAFTLQRKRTVEFYTDATPDQLAWATSQRQIFHLMVFRRPWLAQAYDVTRWAKRRFGAEEQDNAPALQVSLMERFVDLPAQALSLFDAGERESFDLSADWFRLLEPTVASVGARPRYAVLAQDDDVQGVIPLAWQPGGWLRRLNSLTNFYTSLYRPLLSPSLSVDALGTYLRAISKISTIDVWRFDAMDLAHPEFALLESALRRAGFLSFRFFGFGNWYLPVEGRSFEEYFQGLSSQVRNTVRRREKKFLADGRGQLKIVTGGEGLEQAIAAWSEIYRASWKVAEPFPEFMPGLIRMCAARGWLRLGLAYYDGVAVAAQLWIVSHGRAVIYKLAYDEKFAQLSAGTVLTANLMRHVLDVDKVREVDYLIGDDGYKKDWMRHRRERWGLVAYNPRTVRGLFGVSAQTLSEWARRLRMSSSVRKELLDIRYYDSVADLPPTCQSLFQAGEQDSFDLSAEWFRLLSDTSIPEHQVPRFYLLEQDGRARIILPLLLSAPGAGARSVTGLTNFYSTIFRPVIGQNVGVSDLAAMLRQVIKDSKASVLRFDAMDPEHPSFSMLFQALRQAGVVPFKFFGFGNWYLDAKNLSWETYLKQLPGKHRNTLKRLGKKFTEAGGRFKIVADQGPDLEQAIQDYATVYAVSWKVPEPFPNFIPGFIKMCAQRGWLRLGLAYMHDQPVAAQFWIVMHGKACIYKVSYDEKYSEFSPGSLLTGQMMRHVIEVDQVQEVDYLIGDDAYKKIWMSHRRERWGIVAYNPRTLKGLWGAGREMLARSVKWLLKRVGVFRSSFQRKVS